VADRDAGAGLPADRGGGAGLSRRRAPERLEGLIDSHAHLQHEAFATDLDAVIDRAVAAGAELIVVPGWDLASSAAALELAERYGPLIRAAVGVHPHDAGSMDEPAWAALESLASDPRCEAIGEIGLDYHRNLSPPDVQRDAFARHLALAAARDLPVLVHDREAHADVTAALVAWKGARRGILHAFSGDATMAARLTNLGYVVSFALPVAFRSAVGPRDAAARLPDGSFVIETDSPYLGPDAARRNEPTTALRVAAELARLRDSTPLAVASAARTTLAAVLRVA
jgi:TatD DNase family protein